MTATIDDEIGVENMTGIEATDTVETSTIGVGRTDHRVVHVHDPATDATKRQ